LRDNVRERALQIAHYYGAPVEA